MADGSTDMAGAVALDRVGSASMASGRTGLDRMDAVGMAAMGLVQATRRARIG
ncbi:hypothetical protein [Capsulimonas corticalis]|nr:hypothetical protein [Capsulimonas corticalis]